MLILSPALGSGLAWLPFVSVDLAAACSWSFCLPAQASSVQAAAIVVREMKTCLRETQMS